MDGRDLRRRPMSTFRLEVKEGGHAEHTGGVMASVE